METQPRKPYPSDVSDEEWSFVAPYLSPMRPDAPRRVHDPREVYNALRWIVRTGTQWRMLPTEFPLRAAVYQQARRWIDASRRSGPRLGRVVGRGDPGGDRRDGRGGVRGPGRHRRRARGRGGGGIRLEVVKPPGAKRGFVLLPRRWVVERSFARAARCRRLARDDERLPETVAGLHFMVFAYPMLQRLVTLAARNP